MWVWEGIPKPQRNLACDKKSDHFQDFEAEYLQYLGPPPKKK
jgi:hypothetical protein